MALGGSLHLVRPLKRPVVAVGGDVKCVPAAGMGDEIRFGPEVGDLADPESQDGLGEALDRMVSECGSGAVVACDMHPAYFSARIARRIAAARNLRLVEVQHHRAHVAAVLAERRIDGEVVGLAFDGTGYGDDGTIWGGEFFTGSVGGGFVRRGSFAPLRLIGADRAVREVWRIALAALVDRGFGDEAIISWARRTGAPVGDVGLFRRGCELGLNVAVTTALGRWFDLAGALLGICLSAASEAQAAVEMEKAAGGARRAGAMRFSLDRRGSLYIIDVPGLFDLVRDGAGDVLEAAAGFHSAVAEAAAELVRLLAGRSPGLRVVAGGGCFLNKILRGEIGGRLREAGIELVLPVELSVGDAALAAGQIVLADSALRPCSAKLATQGEEESATQSTSAAAE